MLLPPAGTRRPAAPRVSAYSRIEPRLGDMIAWFAASVLTAAAIIYAIKPASPPASGCVNPRPSQEPLALQHARAAEPARGRKASAPMHIPWQGWKDILIRSYHNIEDNRLFALAAGVVFYSLVALIPALAGGVSSYALFADAGTIAKHLSFAADIVPASVIELLETEITRIASKSDGRLTFGFLLGFGIALWSANASIKAIFDALNMIYGEEEKRGIVWLNVVSLFFTLCAFAGSLLATGAIIVFPLVLAALGLSSFDQSLIAFLRWPVLFVLLIVGLAMLYRYAPSRRPARWRWITVGSVSAALAWLVVSSLFSWYLANATNYNATYGALGAVVGLMMWMWLSTIVILVGAVLNSEIEHQTARDTTVGLPKPIGARGAVMADTVGKAIAE
jgi:membrane protein